MMSPRTIKVGIRASNKNNLSTINVKYTPVRKQKDHPITKDVEKVNYNFHSSPNPLTLTNTNTV